MCNSYDPQRVANFLIKEINAPFILITALDNIAIDIKGVDIENNPQIICFSPDIDTIKKLLSFALNEFIDNETELNELIKKHKSNPKFRLN